MDDDASIFLVNNKDLVDLHTSIHRSVAVKPAFLHGSLDANPSHRINDEAWRPPCDVRVGRCWKLTFLLLFLIFLILNILALLTFPMFSLRQAIHTCVTVAICALDDADR